MFTGIVEEIGTVKALRATSQGLDIVISAKKIFEDLKVGDSVAINGCCQTVTSIYKEEFTVQAVAETMNLTNFKNLKYESKVNLERAVTLSTRMGGHLVSGHIDGIGKITAISPLGNSTLFEICTTQEIMKYLVYKGSITINGVSLTICKAGQCGFSVSVIPHTFINTTFSSLRVGDEVNLESDMIARYVEKFMITDDKKNESKITWDFLKENGF